MTTIHFLILSVVLWPWFPLTTRAPVTDRSPWDSAFHSPQLERLTTMVINLQQESFRDYLDADNALSYLPRGPACSNIRLLFILLLKASVYEAKEGCRLARLCTAWQITITNSRLHLWQTPWSSGASVNVHEVALNDGQGV